MNGNVIVLASFFCFVLTSCNPQNRNPASQSGGLKNTGENESGIIQYTVDNSSVSEIADISDLIENVEIIPLVEESGNNIGDIWKVFTLNDHLIVFDQIISKKIHLFSSKGKYIKTIISTGRGPNEAITIADCWVNDYRELEVYDFTLRNIFTYDTLFNLKRKINGDQSLGFTSFFRIPKTGKYFGYSGFSNNPEFNGACYQAAFLDENMKILNKALPFDCKFMGVEGVMILQNQFFQYNDSLRFYKSYDNYIYHVGDGYLAPYAKIRYLKNPTPAEFLNQILSENLEYFQRRLLTGQEMNGRANLLKKYASPGVFLENKYLILLTTLDEDSWYFSVIDKTTRKDTYTAKKFSASRKYHIVLPRFTCYDPSSDTFISYVQGLRLSEYLLPGSKFLEELNIDPSIFYLFKVKFNK